MKQVFWTLSILVLAARLADAQTIDEPHISVGGFELSATGAEKAAGVSLRTGVTTIGSPHIGVFSVVDCGYFTVATSTNAFERNAIVGWRVEITPRRIVNHVVTFRLRWTRALDNTQGLTPASEDIELTLRPGESRPIDGVSVPQTTRTTDGRPCTTKAASLRVSVAFPDLERHLIGADVWLVERLPNGKEQSQVQAVRGLPGRATPFYFDSALDGGDRFDIFGSLVAEPAPGGVEIALETVRARANSGENGYQSAQWFRSKVQLAPDEIVEVALPQMGDNAGAFAKRVFAIRIRAKLLR